MNDISSTMDRFIYPILAPGLVSILRSVSGTVVNRITEIRMRINQPLLLVLGINDAMVNLAGQITTDTNQAYICSSEDVAKTIQLISKNSLYAFEQELKMGFLTINGGHRVGLAGQAIVDGGILKALKNISSLNIRIARQVKGCADKLIPYIISGDKRVLSTLIIAPPRCGKTTLLRDLVRQISSGNNTIAFTGVQVGVVDERSEIAACQNGIPTVELGHRVDVLDGCPKACGILMLIRSMSPQVVVTDELGRQEDALAVREALNAGTSVITSVHGRDVDEILHRPYIGKLIQEKYFERYVVLGNQPAIGTVQEIIAVKHGDLLYSIRKGVKACG